MSNHKGNSSGIGTGSHVEKHKELLINPDTTQKTKNKCIHYEYQSKFCKALKADCVGPSNVFCIHYSESEMVVSVFSKELYKPFTGIKLIDLKSISTEGKKFATPATSKVDQLIKYYEEHKKLDKPVVISYEDGKYILEDKYLRYYVAKKLNLDKIYAILNIPENESALKLLNKKHKIKHKIWGIGIIKAIVSDSIEVEFISSGKTIKFDINTCIKSNVLTLL